MLKLIRFFGRPGIFGGSSVPDFGETGGGPGAMPRLLVREGALVGVIAFPFK